MYIMDDPNYKILTYLIDRFNSSGENNLLDEIFEIISTNEINDKQKSNILHMLQKSTSEIFSYLNIERIENDEYLETVIIMRILDMLQISMYEFQHLSKDIKIKMEKLKLSELSKKINMIIKIDSIFENKLYNDTDFFFFEFRNRVDKLYDQTIYRVK